MVLVPAAFVALNMGLMVQLEWFLKHGI